MTFELGAEVVLRLLARACAASPRHVEARPLGLLGCRRPLGRFLSARCDCTRIQTASFIRIARSYAALEVHRLLTLALLLDEELHVRDAVVEVGPQRLAVRFFRGERLDGSPPRPGAPVPAPPGSSGGCSF